MKIFRDTESLVVLCLNVVMIALWYKIGNTVGAVAHAVAVPIILYLMTKEIK